MILGDRDLRPAARWAAVRDQPVESLPAIRAGPRPKHLPAGVSKASSGPWTARPHPGIGRRSSHVRRSLPERKLPPSWCLSPATSPCSGWRCARRTGSPWSPPGGRQRGHQQPAGGDAAGATAEFRMLPTARLDMTRPPAASPRSPWRRRLLACWPPCAPPEPARSPPWCCSPTPPSASSRRSRSPPGGLGTLCFLLPQALAVLELRRAST